MLIFKNGSRGHWKREADPEHYSFQSMKFNTFLKGDRKQSTFKKIELDLPLYNVHVPKK